MTRKRRVFDISLPDDDTPPPDLETKSAPPPRRGPMASAISENAEALQAQTSTAQAIRAENDALAHEYVARREAGTVIEDIPLDDVHTYLLARDRMPGEDLELDTLVASIRELGLSNPIRVTRRTDGDGVELIQGFRRLNAYKALYAETGDAQYAKVPALIQTGPQDIPRLFRRMVDENVIRKDLSFAEMARAAQLYAMDPATPEHDLSGAVAALFSSAPYSKRSYIKSFAFLLDQIGEYLEFPTEVPRALGVTVARALKERPELKHRIRDDLHDWNMRSIHDELDVLRRHTGHGAIEVDGEADIPTITKLPPKSTAVRAGAVRTTFDLTTSAGRAKCTAAAGKLEIRVDRDFSSLDRARLERAIAGLVDSLG